jgi:hypothetical protein
MKRGNDLSKVMEYFNERAGTDSFSTLCFLLLYVGTENNGPCVRQS